jgi:glycosyltransferase involved in cell wall biosynthesis
MTKIKILMLHRIFASYRKPIYDKLAERYDYILAHSDKEKTIKQAVTAYSKKIPTFQYSKGDTHLFFENFSLILKFKPKVFIHEAAVGILSTLPTYIICKIMGIKFILYGHGYNRLQGFNPKQSWTDKYRAFLMRKAHASIVYTETDRKRLGEYSDIHKIFVAQNTLDTTHLVALRQDFEIEGKGKIQEKIGYTHPYNLIFIGRIIDEKMPEKILEAFDILEGKMPNQVGIHFVGDGDIKPLQDIVEKKNWQNSVKFHGSIYDERQSGEYLFASDLMIMPGYLGLAVNHAFVFDIPIVSFAQTEIGPFHSPEIEYVTNEETGFLVPNLSVEAMATTVEMYLKNPVLQAKMKKNIRHKMEQELTIDNMVKGFTDAIDFVLKKKSTTLEVQNLENTEGVLSK